MRGLGAAELNLFDLFAKISLDTSEYDSGVKDVTKSGESLASKLKSGLATAGKVAATGIGAITAAAGAAVGGLLALEQSTEEYRIAMGRLNTAFESAGYGADAANQAYSEFYGILGDTDRATEASQLLAQLAENEKDVATWTNIAAGVNGTFGDSLPIEGLIEAANETANVGTVTGVLADALNWVGISEDEFNEKLAECSSESERNQLIMETLAGQYDEAADAFYRNNEALVESRENQRRITDTLADVGDSVANVKNKLLDEFAPAIETAGEPVSKFLDNLDVEAIADNISGFFKTIVDNGPTIISIIAGIASGFLAWNVVTTIQGVISAINAFKLANEGASIAQLALNAAMNANPIGIVITAITVLVTVLGTLWVTNEGFRDAVIGIWEQIKAVFVGAWEAIQSAWEAAAPYFQAIWDAIQSIFSVVADVLTGFFSVAWSGISAVWDVVTGYFENIWNTIKGIFSVVESVLSGDFEGAWEAIQGVFDGWADFFGDLWDSVTDAFAGVWDWFVGIGEDIVNGIKQGIENIWDGLVEWFSGLWDSLFGSRKTTIEVERRVTGDSIDGSHASGLSYVPFDGYLAELHKGEMVLTRAQAAQLRSIGFERSGLGVASAGIINSVSGNSSGDNSYTFNLVLPDGSKLASYMFRPLTDYARANGTPILNPT